MRGTEQRSARAIGRRKTPVRLGIAAADMFCGAFLLKVIIQAKSKRTCYFYISLHFIATGLQTVA
jgi:hypothetical protein